LNYPTDYLYTLGYTMLSEKSGTPNRNIQTFATGYYQSGIPNKNIQTFATGYYVNGLLGLRQLCRYILEHNRLAKAFKHYASIIGLEY